MAIGSGLAGQVGIKTEATVNTPIAVTTFTEPNKVAFDARPNFAQGKGLAAGGLSPEANRRVLTSLDGGGSVEFDIPNKGLGQWMQALMGSYATTATQIGVTTAWQQIHNLGSADGKAFTLQVGCPSIDGTVNPLTYSGCKVTDWTITSSPNAIATLAATVDAMNVQPTGAGALGLQAASFSATTGLYAFQQLTVQTFAAYTTVSSLLTPTSPASIGIVRNATIKGSVPKDTARWQAGSLTKAEALINDFQEFTGTIDVDFASMTLYNQFVANTATGIQFTWTGPTAGGANNNTLQFTFPSCFLEQGSTPQLTGPGVITVSYPFTVRKDATGNTAQCYIISTDTTV